MDLTVVMAILSALASAGTAQWVTSLFARRARESSGPRIEVTKRELEAALDEAVTHVEAPATPTPASEPVIADQPATSAGKREALALVEVYMRDLLAEASRIAKRLGAESASAVHVREAAARIGILRSRTGVAADIILAIGSLLIGVAISYYVNLWTGGRPVAGTAVYALVSLASGVALFTWAATSKWNQR